LSPAQAAGVDSRLWEIGDIVKAVEDGNKTLKSHAILLVWAALFAGSASSYADTPILLRDTLQPGIIEPKPLPLLTLPPTTSDRAINSLCFVFDIGNDGHVSNMRVLRSSGLAYVDAKALGWWQHKQYEPATLNGVPTAVRLLGDFHLGSGVSLGGFKKDSPDDSCSWKLYDSQSSEPKPN